MNSLLSTLLVLSIAVYFASAIKGYNLLDDMKKKFHPTTFDDSFFQKKSMKRPSSPNFDIPNLKEKSGAKIISMETYSKQKMSKTKNCTNNDHTTQTVKLNDRTCVWEATLEKADNGPCNYYTYYKKTVTSTSSPVTDVNNGVAKCTQKKCGSSDEPITVDCLEAFGKDDILNIENTEEKH